jgi:hypothetical protein
MKSKNTLLLSAGALALAFGGIANAQGAGYPPDAQPGQCFARVLIPEITEVVTEQVLDVAASKQIRVIPATFETVTETVIIKEESIVFETVPAVFETVTETVVIEPERTESIVVPAVTSTVSEQIMVRPAYTTWKPGAGLFGRGSAGAGGQGIVGVGGEMATGELLCKVEVPAEYRTVTRTVVSQPERTDTRIIPAVTREVSRQVVAQPPRVVERVIPAETRTVEVRRLVSEAREEVIEIPATFKTIEKSVVTGGGGLEWREVLCDTNTTTAKIAEVQRALTAAGYANPSDGAFGPQTLRAMEAFQRDRGLPIGYLTVDTVRALGVQPF